MWDFIGINDDNQMQMIRHYNIQRNIGVWIVAGNIFNAFLCMLSYFR